MKNFQKIMVFLFAALSILQPAGCGGKGVTRGETPYGTAQSECSICGGSGTCLICHGGGLCGSCDRTAGQADMDRKNIKWREVLLMAAMTCRLPQGINVRNFFSVIKGRSGANMGTVKGKNKKKSEQKGDFRISRTAAARVNSGTVNFSFYRKTHTAENDHSIPQKEVFIHLICNMRHF